MNTRSILVSAGLSVFAAASALGADDFSVTLEAPAKAVLGTPVTLKVAVKNRGKDATVKEPMLDVKSFGFEVKFGEGAPSPFTQYHPTSYEPSNLKGQDLQAGKTLEFEHSIVPPVAGAWTFTPVWNGSGTPVKGEPKTITIEPKDGATRLLWRIETTAGVMDAAFMPEVAPATTLHIAALVQRGFYDGSKFHRVMKDFMIQGGDPKGNGTGGPGYSMPAEFNATKHERGILSMARTPDVNSAGCQIFLCHGTNAQIGPALDGKYTVFAKLTAGLDILDKIATSPVRASMRGEMSDPVDPVKLTKCTLAPDAAAPAAEKKDEKPSKAPPAGPTKPDGGRR
jgi:peptidyl-prolyl cis-trans isomerase B (cyclophilin B)